MKVHRIIASIEVENDNSITSVELIKLHPINTDISLVITNITTNGNADNIQQVYTVIDNYRLFIDGKLKAIADTVNAGLDDYEYRVITDDNTIPETTDNLLS
nr:MAG: hypothetical protein [Bacteriophage sp.]